MPLAIGTLYYENSNWKVYVFPSPEYENGLKI